MSSTLIVTLPRRKISWRFIPASSLKQLSFSSLTGNSHTMATKQDPEELVQCSLLSITHNLLKVINSGLKDIMPGATNPRGIPTAPFIDRVEDYVANRTQVEGVLKNFQEMISYVFIISSSSRISVCPNKTKSQKITKANPFAEREREKN